MTIQEGAHNQMKMRDMDWWVSQIAQDLGYDKLGGHVGIQWHVGVATGLH
jgi:hypothetical protein